ncbi:MAG: hypothetical protein ACI9MK_001804, partial [Oceanospirillaceae bacterium]
LYRFPYAEKGVFPDSTLRIRDLRFKVWNLVLRESGV